MRTLYLHIGVHRTATSSVQAFLHGDPDGLLRRGYLYPYGVRRHFKLFNELFDGRRQAGEAAQDLNRRADARRLPVHSIILSDEDICMRRDLGPLAAFADSFDVKVVFALRRQDLWLESWYLQNVKWQWNPDLCHLTFPEFLARRREFHWIDYAATVRRLEQAFGPENIRLYTFEKAAMAEGPVAAFAAAAGLGDLDGMKPPPHANPSHSPAVSEFMRRLPLDRAPQKYRGELERACARLDQRLAKSPAEASPLLLDHDRRRAILDEYAEGNAWLAARHFARDRLFSEPLPDRSATVAEMALPGDGDSLMTRFVAPFLEEMIAAYAARPPQDPPGGGPQKGARRGGPKGGPQKGARKGGPGGGKGGKKGGRAGRPAPPAAAGGRA